MRVNQYVAGGFTFRDAFRLTSYADPTFHRPADPRPLVSTSQGAVVELLDALGQSVREVAAAPTAVLDPHGLARGIYTVRAGAESRRQVVD